MNILIAGVHAVGKSFLCEKFSTEYGWVHRSASQLIKEELDGVNWSRDKQITDAENNQLALIRAVHRKNAKGERLLLDGHFVLRGTNDKLIRLGPEIFSDLNLRGVVLLEAPAEVIIARLSKRDEVKRSFEDVQLFIQAERNQAKDVCKSINVPLIMLNEPPFDDFAANVNRLS